MALRPRCVGVVASATALTARRAFVRRVGIAALATALLPSLAASQTSTYHAHIETVQSGVYRLATDGPDTGSTSISSPDLFGQPVSGEYIFAQVGTDTGVPALTGTLPSGSTITYSVWMQKSGTASKVYARAKLSKWDGGTGKTELCAKTASSTMSTTLVKYTFNCTTASAIAFTASDRLLLEVGGDFSTSPGQHTLMLLLYLEGAAGGNYDSTVVVPIAPSSTPTISSLDPGSGGVGQAVTITGTNFGTTQGTSTVTFNGTAASPTAWGSTSITTPVPSGATSGPVVVTVGGQASNGVTFTVLPPPTISSLDPTSGAMGQSVTIAGTNFGAAQGASTVTFNGTTATPTTWGSSSITAPVPSGATTGPVVVTVGGQASNGVTFTVIPAPTITSLNPTSGVVNDPVTITGTNFGLSQGTSAVTFNGTAATPTNWSATSITTPVPIGATTGPVVVTVGGQASNGVTFTVTSSVGTITGTITRADDSAAVVGATVRAVQQGQTITTSTSNGSGTYTLSNLSAGTYDLQVSAPNYAEFVQSGVAVSNGTVTVDIALSRTGVSYTYDSAGRLIRVSDGSGRFAEYAYDNVGNLLSIARETSSNIVVIGGFAPSTGYAGDTVTITGAGFSVTPADNVVRFAGQPGTVTASTATELTVIVPLGAASGPIAVAAPTGQAVSNAIFTVLGEGLPPNLPTITNVSPTGGSAGTSVTITGTNFDATPGSNQILFNGTPASVNTATSTQLTTTVPTGATSGRVKVSTPAGEALSAVDFTVPPTTYSAGDVDNVSRSAYDETRTVSIASPGKIAVVLFDGNAGDWINVDVAGSTFGGSCGTWISVIGPSGSVLREDCGEWFGFGGSGWIEGIRLPTTGTYTVTVAPFAPTTGSLQLTIIADVLTTITVDGPPQRVGVRVPRQNARAFFTATAGDRLGVSGSDMTPASTLIAFVQDDGTLLANSDYWLRNDVLDEGCPPWAGCFVDNIIPATGTYMILVDPEEDEIGSVMLTLQRPTADVTLSITPGGSAVTAANTAEGQNVILTFTGNAGQYVSFKVVPNTVSIFTTIRLVAPDGTVLASGYLNSGQNFIDAVALPSNGVYTIVVDPNNGSVGDAVVTLYNVVDATAVGTIGGDPVALSMSTPGQNGRVTFDGVPGQRIGVQLSAMTTPSATISILNPDGSVLVGPVGAFVPAFMDAVMSSAGTYTVLFNPSFDYTGSATIALTAPPSDVVNTITAGGDPVTITTMAAGQNGQITFGASSGERVSLRLTNVTMSSSAVSIRKPDGSTLASTTVSTSGGFIDTNVLADNGTYTVVVDPTGSSAGSMTLTLFNVPADTNATVTVNGAPATVSVGTPGQQTSVAFAGTANQHVGITLSDDSISSSSVRLLDSAGATVLGPTTVTTSGGFLDTVLLTTDTFTLAIDPVSTATGSLTAAVSIVPADVIGSIAADGSSVPVSITASGQNARLTFTGTAGQRVSLHVTNVPFTCVVTILKPDGTNLASSTIGTSGGFIDTNVLATSGSYAVRVDPQAGATGTLTLTLYDVPPDLTGSIVPGGSPVTVTTGTPGQGARVTFDAAAGQRISLSVSNVTMTSVNVAILSPGQTVGTGQTIDPSGAFIDTVGLVSGTYTIQVNPTTTSTGSVTLTLYNVPADAGGSLVIGGASAPVTITTPGQNGDLFFDGVVGQQVTVHVTGNTLGSASVRLIAPDLSVMTSVTSNAASFDLPTRTLPITGPYHIVVDPPSANTGSATISVTTP